MIIIIMMMIMIMIMDSCQGLFSFLFHGLEIKSDDVRSSVKAQDKSRSCRIADGGRCNIFEQPRKATTLLPPIHSLATQ